MLLDVDHFKQVNDTFGHQTGDSVLNTIGSCLTRHLRSYDVISRYGGDEFAALCCNCGPDEITAPIRRLQEAIGSLSIPRLNEFHPLSISIGVAVVRKDLELWSPAELTQAADRCLYQAKNAGRDRAFCTVIDGMPGEESMFEIHASV